jgi:hypothetical protein
MGMNWQSLAEVLQPFSHLRGRFFQLRPQLVREVIG